MKKLFSRFFRHPWLTSELLVASFLINLLGLASTVYIIQVLNRYVNHGIDATLYTLTTGVVIAIVLDFAFKMVRVQLAESISLELGYSVPKQAFQTLIGARAGALQQLDMGLKREIMNGLNKIHLASSPNSIITLLDIPYAILFLAALALLSPLLAGVATGFVLFYLCITLLINKRLRSHNNSQSEIAAKHASLIGSSLKAMDDIRGFNAQKQIMDRWQSLNEEQENIHHRINKHQGLNFSMTFAAVAILGVIMIALGAKLVVNEELTIGGMIGCNILAARALQPMSRFAMINSIFIEAAQAFKLIEQFNQLPMESLEGSAPEEFKGDLEIKNLVFSYASSPAPLFKQFNLNIPRGNFVVICGNNGSGKTTLARLLMSFMFPTRGQFLLDGVELRQFNLEWWRNQLIYFPQEPVFFDGSLKENLCCLNPDMSEEQMKELINKVGLNQYVDMHPQGLERPIVDGGLNMSKGLRRRLAFARALSRDASIAIIDEPGDGMDAEGSRMIIESINSFLQSGKTVIMFSHNRPETFKNAHTIVDLNQQPVKVQHLQVQPKVNEGHESSRS